MQHHRIYLGASANCVYAVYEACHMMHEAPTLPQRQLHVALKALFDPSLAEFKSCRAREDQPFWNMTNATNTTTVGSPEPKSGACARKLEPGGVLSICKIWCFNDFALRNILPYGTVHVHLSTSFILWPSLHFPPMYHWKLYGEWKGERMAPWGPVLRTWGIAEACSSDVPAQRNWLTKMSKFVNSFIRAWARRTCVMPIKASSTTTPKLYIGMPHRAFMEDPASGGLKPRSRPFWRTITKSPPRSSEFQMTFKKKQHYGTAVVTLPTQRTVCCNRNVM